jgi:hypothetical protein
MGFAYNVRSKSKTVVRGGFGVMFAPQPWDTMANAVANSVTIPFRLNPSRTELQRYGLKFPAFNEQALKIAATAVRGPASWNVDFSFGKNFAVTQRVRVQIRADGSNALNDTPLSGVTAGANSVNFGLLTSNVGARQVQLNGRLSW